MPVRTCACRVCVRHDRIEKILASDVLADIKTLFQEIYEDLGYVEEDLEYQICILSGTWPSSVKQLTEALIRAKDYEEQEKKSESQ